MDQHHIDLSAIEQKLGQLPVHIKLQILDERKIIYNTSRNTISCGRCRNEFQYTSRIFDLSVVDKQAVAILTHFTVSHFDNFEDILKLHYHSYPTLKSLLRFFNSQIRLYKSKSKSKSQDGITYSPLVARHRSTTSRVSPESIVSRSHRPQSSSSVSVEISNGINNESDSSLSPVGANPSQSPSSSFAQSTTTAASTFQPFQNNPLASTTPTGTTTMFNPYYMSMLPSNGNMPIQLVFINPANGQPYIMLQPNGYATLAQQQQQQFMAPSAFPTGYSIPDSSYNSAYTPPTSVSSIETIGASFKKSDPKGNTISFYKLENLAGPRSNKFKQYILSFITPTTNPIDLDDDLNEELNTVKRGLLKYVNSIHTNQFEFYITIRNIKVESVKRETTYFIISVKLPLEDKCKLMVIGIITVLPGMDYVKLASYILLHSIEWKHRLEPLQRIKLCVDQPFLELYSTRLVIPCSFDVKAINNENGNLKVAFSQFASMLTNRANLIESSDDVLLNSLMTLNFVQGG